MSQKYSHSVFVNTLFPTAKMWRQLTGQEMSGEGSRGVGQGMVESAAALRRLRREGLK